jgi:nicotinamidase-related amidase
VFVVGLALDFCVFNTSVDAVSFGFKTHLIKEGTRPVVPSVTDEIYEKLKNVGVEITDIKSLPPFRK